MPLNPSILLLTDSSSKQCLQIEGNLLILFYSEWFLPHIKAMHVRISATNQYFCRISHETEGVLQTVLKNVRWIIASETHVFTCFIDGLAFWAYIICKVFCHLLFLSGLIYCVIGYSCVKGSLVFDLIFSVKCNRVPLHLWTDKYHTSHIHT